MFEQRKQMIVDKNLQFRITRLAVASGLVICLFSIFGLYLLSNRMIRVIELASPGSELVLNAITEFNKISIYFVALTMISLIWTWVSALYLSHRIAGPIHKMMSVLDEHEAGKKDARITLRKKDFFTPLAEKINKLLDGK